MVKLYKARVIIHVDLDYFYAQCEERKNPSYKDKPVVVCVYTARGGDSGAVSTANYVARKFGVKSGISITLAKRLLKGRDAIFLPVNHELYDKISLEIMRILRDHGDCFEQVSIDEAYLDVSQKVNGDFSLASELAKRIKEEILKREKLTCSIGVGPNKLVAKIAAGHKKPDGLTVVRPEEVKNFLFPLPVNKLLGVGRKTEKAMLEFGIKTIDDLANYNLESLVKVFGKNLGIYFHNASKGIDETPVQERGRAEQISRITTLREDTHDIASILEALDRLCKEVHATIVEQGLSFRSISIIVVTEDLNIHSRSKTLEASTDDRDIVKEVSKELLEKFLREKSDLKVRRVGIKVSNLVESTRQKHLTEFLATEGSND